MKKFLKRGYGIKASIALVALSLCLVSGIGLVSAQGGTNFLKGTISVTIVGPTASIAVDYLDPNTYNWTLANSDGSYWVVDANYTVNVINSLITPTGALNWTQFTSGCNLTFNQSLTAGQTYKIPFRVTNNNSTAVNVTLSGNSTNSTCNITVGSPWTTMKAIPIGSNSTYFVTITPNSGTSGNCSITLNWTW